MPTLSNVSRVSISVRTLPDEKAANLRYVTGVTGEWCIEPKAM